MTNVIKKATNKFTKGLVMDFSPENTKNEVLTHALNATLLTFNGNEMSLQNDMGNARVETAYLPEGYMPVGTCEYGGIIYIVSYNPLEDKSLIGCFPSPERNISRDEIGSPKASISREDFLKVDEYGPTGVLKHNTKYVLLKNDNLNPGDKFLICSDQSIYNEKLENLLVKKDVKRNSEAVKDENGYELEPHPILALNVVSIEESGKIVYLNSDIRRYDVDNDYKIDGTNYTDTYRYHILGTGGNVNGEFNQLAIDIDSYRNALSSGYSVFKSKTSGKLAILAELIMIDSYSVTHSLQPSLDEYDQPVEGKFDVIIHTEVEPHLTKENFTTAPKLRYYYLENSQGYIQYYNSESSTIDNRGLFEKVKNVWKNNLEFLNTKLQDIYNEVKGVNLNKTLGVYSSFNFPYPETYYGKMVSYVPTETTDGSIYTKLTEGKYHRFSLDQIANNKTYFQTIVKFYKYDPKNEGYKLVDESHDFNQEYTYYVEIPISEYIDAKRDKKYNKPEQTLYKLTTSAQIATATEIKNVLIEKFLYEEIQAYILASEEDKAAGKELWSYDEASLKFTSLTGSPQDGVTYYIRKVERSLVSIGYDIDANQITGAIYYYPTTKNYEQATDEDKEKYFDFVTYPYDKDKASYGCPITLYYLKKSTVYKPATLEQIDERESLNIVLYYISKYVHISNITNYQDEGLLLFMVAPIDTFLTEEQFVPNESYNYIYGVGKKGNFEKDDPLYLYTLSNFIPDQSNNEATYTPYHDIKLGSIQLPSLVYKNGIDLPFKYDYTIVPCMNYGRLDHLAISNTVDFSKLHAFNQSKVSTWKYRIDDGYLRLTIGADVFDTYETHKVDGIVLEFYDHRGFAGSFEFTGKKSYNGVFTKIIPLNALGALNTKKIYTTNYVNDYKHNVNIVYDAKTQSYKLNNSTTEHSITTGWDISDADNDCGILYSNILYGVKVYLRRSIENQYEFIKKGDYFIYTLPLLNDYYYKVLDFSTLINPQLEIMLTYRITDRSNKQVYNNTDLGISNGYLSLDSENMSKYNLGAYESSDSRLDVTKYYKYSGTTNLQLEVGLKQDYNKFNLAYSLDLNKYFSCKLQLLSDDDKDKSFNVTSTSKTLFNADEMLNYHNSDGYLTQNINKLVFANDKSEIQLTSDEFYNLRFLNTETINTVPITYEFIVGYEAYVSNIRETEIDAICVCALCHKNADDTYNYSDFGVYEVGTDFYSSSMLYNTGCKDTEIFGVCKLVALDNDIENQVRIVNEFKNNSIKITSEGKLNTSGDGLKTIYASNIGKYLFCLPHVHVINTTYGANVYATDVESYYLRGITKRAITPDKGNFLITESGRNDYDVSYGIAPDNTLYNTPLFNLSVNTYASVNYQSEFISTIGGLDNRNIVPVKYRTVEYRDDDKTNWTPDPQDAREFVGFTGSLIVVFNNKLINTMKHVYAYNPDYNKMKVNVGNVELQTHHPIFTSNLLCVDSKFNFGDKTLNDFIYFGQVCVSDYIKDLNKYSLSILNEDSIMVFKDKSSEFIDLLSFKPNYTYCGTSVSPYLISQLSYNTPVVSEISSDLQYTGSDNVIVKHEDGSIGFLKCKPDKKKLYGYSSKYKKLAILDVSNYTIDINGNLLLTNLEAAQTVSLSDTFTQEDLLKLFTNHKLSKNVNIEISQNGERTKIPALLEFDITSRNASSKLTSLVQNESGEMFLMNEVEKINTTLGIKLTVKVTSLSNLYKCSVLSGSYVQLNTLEGRHLKPALIDSDTVMTKDFGELKNLIKESENSSFWVDTSSPACCNVIGSRNNSLPSLNATLPLTSSRSIEPKINPYLVTVTLTNNKSIEVYCLKFKELYLQIKVVNDLYSSENDIINTVGTADYYTHPAEYCYTLRYEYRRACIRGTTMTINDLEYDYAKDHKLYVKSSLYSYAENGYRGRIFYRSHNKKYNDNPEWSKDYLYYNHLYLQTGPSFNYLNLEHDDIDAWDYK